QVRQDQTKDGVASSQSTSYLPNGLDAPYSGQPVHKTSTTAGGNGSTETFVDDTRYGYDVDPVFRTLNLLTAEVESVTTWTPQTGAPVAIQSRATTFAPWRSGAGADVRVPAQEADFAWLGGVAAQFPFAGYQPGQTPPGWSLSSRVLTRTERGLVVDSADG